MQILHLYLYPEIHVIFETRQHEYETPVCLHTLCNATILCLLYSKRELTSPSLVSARRLYIISFIHLFTWCTLISYQFAPSLPMITPIYLHLLQTLMTPPFISFSYKLADSQ